MAVETRTVVEIDGAPSHLDLDGALARRAIAAGAMVAIDSDCHRAERLDRQMELGHRHGAARLGGAAPRAQHAAARRGPRAHCRETRARADDPGRGAAAVGVALAAFALYRATLLPGFDFGDTGSFQATVGSHADHAARRLPALLRHRPTCGCRWSAAIRRTR